MDIDGCQEKERMDEAQQTQYMDNSEKENVYLTKHDIVWDKIDEPRRTKRQFLIGARTRV